jgi:hypothetical protein
MQKRLGLIISGVLMLFAVFAFATTMTVNIEPNKEGVIDKSKNVNIVVKLIDDFVIDVSQIVIKWDDHDITQAFLNSAASQLNDSKTEITFYSPISAAELKPGQHTISATTGNGKWYESTLTIQDMGDESFHFSYSSLQLSAGLLGSSQSKAAAVQLTKDTTKPAVKSMNASPSSIYLGEEVAISYSVTDNVALKQVELWVDDGTGWKNPSGKVNSASGTSSSGSFKHTPSKTGTTKYGIHVVDKAGNWNSEGSVGPKSVTVIAPDTTKPVVKSMSASPSSVYLGQEVTISYTVTDNVALKQVELWVFEPSSDWKNPSGKVNSVSGTSSSGAFKHTPSKTGTTKYGIHVVDKAGNWNSEGSAGPKLVTVNPFHRPLDPAFTTVSLDLCDNNPGYGNHRGVDITAINGKPVYAITGGAVKHNHNAYSRCDNPSSSCWNGDKGKTTGVHWNAALIVQYDLPDGPVYVYYGHVTSELNQGDPVDPKNSIGTVNLKHLRLSVNKQDTSYWGYSPTNINESCDDIMKGGWKRFQDVFNMPEYKKVP